MNNNKYVEWLQLCIDRAMEFSPDPSTKNAAVIVDEKTNSLLGFGVNEFPFGVEYYDQRWERPDKYLYIEHAERNAIFNSAQLKNDVVGATMICPWAACSDCARAIIQNGIKRLVRTKVEATNSRWSKSCVVADQMLKEACVEIIEIDEPLGKEILRNGEIVIV